MVWSVRDYPVEVNVYVINAKTKCVENPNMRKVMNLIFH